jgi:UPF0288 family protein (methanogenesis marker protein 3)
VDFFNFIVNNKKNKIIKLYYFGDICYDKLFRKLDVLTHKRIGKLRIYNTFDPIDTSK